MVILDKVSNGYREFILPMALQDEVLCRAVAVVATQHLSQGQPALELAAEKGRTAVISRLRRDASLASQVFNEFTWATLIVLLVGETVTITPTTASLSRCCYACRTTTPSGRKSHL